MTMTNYEIIQKLAKKHNAEKEEFIRLLTSADEADFELLGRLARKLTLKIYGNKIFIRGLIEISSYCKMNAFTAEYAVQIKTLCVTALIKSRFCSAVIRDISWAFAPL